jgi:hypothetical protein
LHAQITILLSVVNGRVSSDRINSDWYYEKLQPLCLTTVIGIVQVLTCVQRAPSGEKIWGNRICEASILQAYSSDQKVTNRCCTHERSKVVQERNRGHGLNYNLLWPKYSPRLGNQDGGGVTGPAYRHQHKRTALDGDGANTHRRDPDAEVLGRQLVRELGPG